MLLSAAKLEKSKDENQTGVAFHGRTRKREPCRGRRHGNETGVSFGPREVQLLRTIVENMLGTRASVLGGPRGRGLKGCHFREAGKCITHVMKQ